eukprot:UN26891
MNDDQNYRLHPLIFYFFVLLYVEKIFGIIVIYGYLKKSLNPYSGCISFFCLFFLFYLKG